MKHPKTFKVHLNENDLQYVFVKFVFLTLIQTNAIL